jgi:hypothetical protein
MVALEARARLHGNTHYRLLGSVTAQHFYRSLGYVVIGREESKYGTAPGYLMSRCLPI